MQMTASSNALNHRYVLFIGKALAQMNGALRDDFQLHESRKQITDCRALFDVEAKEVMAHNSPSPEGSRHESC